MREDWAFSLVRRVATIMDARFGLFNACLNQIVVTRAGLDKQLVIDKLMTAASLRTPTLPTNRHQTVVFLKPHTNDTRQYSSPSSPSHTETVTGLSRTRSLTVTITLASSGTSNSPAPNCGLCTRYSHGRLTSRTGGYAAASANSSAIPTGTLRSLLLQKRRPGLALVVLGNGHWPTFLRRVCMQYDLLNANRELYNDVTYQHALTGSDVPASVGIVRVDSNSRLPEISSMLLCEQVFVSGLFVTPHTRVPAALRHAGVTQSLIADMQRYSRTRGINWIGFSGIVNPGLLAALRRRGFSTLSSSLDGRLDHMVLQASGSDTAFMRVFAILQGVTRSTNGKGVVLVQAVHPVPAVPAV